MTLTLGDGIADQANATWTRASSERGIDPPISILADQIDALDTELFSHLTAQTGEWDRRALLAIQSAAAAKYGSFAYPEVGSFRGGSLQAVMRATPPAICASFLCTLPEVEMDKLATVDVGTDDLRVSDLLDRPAYCFIDGEHTHDAAVRDARFCAFSGPLGPRDGGGVFALEIGLGGLLQAPVVRRAVGSRWHWEVWRVVNRARRSALPFLIAWATMPAIDAALVGPPHGFRQSGVQLRHGIRHYARRRPGAAG